ncbi:MAG TPA: hypothetical protein VLR93_01160 [Patescibacteria group bacterium]|nr:hypothetical protein [Patescibacteria group bacterium]
MARSADWYRDDENWGGPWVEVAIDLGPRDDQRLMEAFRAAWRSPLLDGPLESRNGEPAPNIDAGFLGPFSYGTIELPSAPDRLGCIVSSVRDEESDWLDCSIPTGMLDLAYEVVHPVSHDANAWFKDVEGALVSIAVLVNAAVPFDLAIIGDEVSGLHYASSRRPGMAITAEAIERTGGYLVSSKLWERLASTAQAELLSGGLRWVRSTW